MRVNQSVMTGNMLKNLQKNMKKLDRLNQQLSSGKEFNLPSQNPVGVSTSMKYSAMLESQDQYTRNISEAQVWVENTEGVLDNVSKSLQRARELAVYAGNNSLNNEDKMAIAKELKQLQNEIITNANAKVGNRYIFSGQMTDTPAYDNNGKYQGDSQPINREIGPGIEIKINADGQKLFQDGIDTLKALEQHIENGGSTSTEGEITIDKIGDALNLLDDQVDNNLQNRSELGAKINRLEFAENRLDQEQIRTKELLSENEEVDIAEKITDLKMQESVYQASLSIGSRIMQPSLVDFLR